MTTDQKNGIALEEDLGEIKSLMRQSRDWNFIWREMSTPAKEQFRKRIQEKRRRDSLEIIELLNKNKINFIVLKGLTLQYFNEIRRFDDLDIYVPPDDYQKAAALIESLDFTPLKNETKQKQRGWEIPHHIQYHKTNNVRVELHYRLFFNTSGLERKLPVMEEKIFLNIDGIPVPCLSKELQLLTILLHNFFNHGFLDYYRKTFEDTRCLLQNYDMDWNKFLIYVHKTGYHELFYRLIILLNVFYGENLTIPDYVVAELKKNSSDIRLQLTKGNEAAFHNRYCTLNQIPSENEKGDSMTILDWTIRYHLLFSLGFRPEFFRQLIAYNLFSADALRTMVRLCLSGGIRKHPGIH